MQTMSSLRVRCSWCTWRKWNTLVPWCLQQKDLENSAFNSPKEQMFLSSQLWNSISLFTVNIPKDHPKNLLPETVALMSFFCSSASPWAKVHSSPAKVGWRESLSLAWNLNTPWRDIKNRSNHSWVVEIFFYLTVSSSVFTFSTFNFLIGNVIRSA